MPGISPGRSRLSDGRLRGGLGGFGVPPRSSFGARLRSRLPQYGHSVMYGDTSRPQLRHTTKRSGPLAIGLLSLIGPSGRDDLFKQLRPVVVGLVDDPLALGARAALEQVGDALQLPRAAEVLRVLAQPVV